MWDMSHHQRDCVLEGWLNLCSWRSFRSCVMRLSDWKPTGEQACPCRQCSGLSVHISSLTAAQGSAAGARLGRADAVADLAHGVGYCQQLLIGQLHTHTCV